MRHFCCKERAAYKLLTAHQLTAGLALSGVLLQLEVFLGLFTPVKQLVKAAIKLSALHGMGPILDVVAPGSVLWIVLHGESRS